MAILLALFFISSPIKGGLRNIFELLDAAPVSDISLKIKKTVSKYSHGLLTVNRLRIRKAGQKVFIEACFIAEDNFTIGKVNELAQSFEHDLKSSLPDCDVVVYFKSRKEKQ